MKNVCKNIKNYQFLLEKEACFLKDILTKISPKPYKYIYFF
jgi:hypothetical protein